MTRGELIQALSEATGMPQKHAELLVTTFFDSIRQALMQGEKVELRGFGTFRMRTRQARQARNPRTGEKVWVEPRKMPVFKAGKRLRERLNGKD